MSDTFPGGVFAVPVTRNSYASHQWLRELKRRDQGPIAGVYLYLHQGLTQATENIQAREDGTQVTLDFRDWQRVLAKQMLLASYLRLVADPPGE